MTSHTASAYPRNGLTEELVKALPSIKPRIIDEYPELTEEDLRRLDEDPNAVVQKIAEKTGHTRILVVSQLAELVSLQQHHGTVMRRMSEALDRIEAKTRQAMKYAREDLPRDVGEAGRKARHTVEDNVWVSLLFALGLGFIVGFFSRGVRT